MKVISSESRDDGNSKERLQDDSIYLFVDNEDVRVCKFYNLINLYTI